MNRAYLVYEEPCYWKKYPGIPCLKPDLVVYKNPEKLTEMFRWPGFLSDWFPEPNAQYIEHRGETYEIIWLDEAY